MFGLDLLTVLLVLVILALLAIPNFNAHAVAIFQSSVVATIKHVLSLVGVIPPTVHATPTPPVPPAPPPTPVP